MADVADKSDEKRTHFTYIWAIENGSFFFSFTQFVSSPVFIVESMEKTEWYLEIFRTSEGSHISMRLWRENDGGPERIEIVFEFAFLRADGLPLKKTTDSITLAKNKHLLT
ncbi:hypothetical protein AVEN_25412-1 [Araneus ventricosus]|uniref:MATH domain-containing protein n=1 Tax=Araneus ventricosus TaxID=182803 RepID=A0A4Y2IA53_ARAVE|nr:hypothetical protein AVEN_25412-1 [Araneus ventricosus]